MSRLASASRAPPSAASRRASSAASAGDRRQRAHGRLGGRRRGGAAIASLDGSAPGRRRRRSRRPDAGGRGHGLGRGLALGPPGLEPGEELVDGLGGGRRRGLGPGRRGLGGGADAVPASADLDVEPVRLGLRLGALLASATGSVSTPARRWRRAPAVLRGGLGPGLGVDRRPASSAVTSRTSSNGAAGIDLVELGLLQAERRGRIPPGAEHPHRRRATLGLRVVGLAAVRRAVGARRRGSVAGWASSSDSGWAHCGRHRRSSRPPAGRQQLEARSSEGGDLRLELLGGRQGLGRPPVGRRHRRRPSPPAARRAARRRPRRPGCGARPSAASSRSRAAWSCSTCSRKVARRRARSPRIRSLTALASVISRSASAPPTVSAGRASRSASAIRSSARAAPSAKARSRSASSVARTRRASSCASARRSAARASALAITSAATSSPAIDAARSSSATVARNARTSLCSNPRNEVGKARPATCSGVSRGRSTTPDDGRTGVPQPPRMPPRRSSTGSTRSSSSGTPVSGQEALLAAAAGGSRAGSSRAAAGGSAAAARSAGTAALRRVGGSGRGDSPVGVGPVVPSSARCRRRPDVGATAPRLTAGAGAGRRDLAGWIARSPEGRLDRVDQHALGHALVEGDEAPLRTVVTEAPHPLEPVVEVVASAEERDGHADEGLAAGSRPPPARRAAPG